MPFLVATTVFAFASGSSSVDAVTRIGRDARWVVLILLFVAAAAWAVQRGRLLALPARVPAAAAGFLVLALASALWSVAPRLSAERAVSLGLLLAAALLLSVAVRGRPAGAERLLVGLLGGAVTVALAGLLLLAVDYQRAVEPRSIEVPWRFQGFGQNPNTAALLFALGVPIALSGTLAAQTRTRRALLAAALALLAGSIVASGSRGALFSAGLGSLAVVFAWRGVSRKSALAVVALLACVGAGVGIQQIPQPAPISPPPASSAPAQPAPKPPRYANVDDSYPLDADIGRPLPGGGEPTLRRSFFAASGRGQAWAGAIGQAAQRPLLGFGFGTEAKVFVDRYYYFIGGVPENAYIGITLQLGIVGLLALGTLVAVLVTAGRTALAGPYRLLAGACLGAVLAGLGVAVVQSYLYSAGNIAAATFWISAFLLPALAAAVADG